MTAQTINKIAKQTKKICSENGYGRQVVVFAGGRVEEAIGPNDVVAIDSGDGWKYPICRLRYPMSAAQVRAAIEQAKTEAELLSEAETEGELLSE